MTVAQMEVSSAGCLTGALAGLLTVLCVSLRTEWSFFYLGPIGVAITVTAGYFISLLMEPPPPGKTLGLVKGLPDPSALPPDARLG